MFGVKEGVTGLAFIIWMVLTILFFGRTSIDNFHVNLTVESDSTKKISDIPGLSTISDVGAVMVFISSGLLILYIACIFAMYFLKVKDSKIFYSNIVIFIILSIGIVLGILFLCLKL